MNDELAMIRKRTLKLRTLTATLLGAWVAVACFGDKTDPGQTGDDAQGGDAGDDGRGGSNRGGSSGSSQGGNDVGGEGGDASGGTGVTGGTSSGGRGGRSMGGMSGAGGGSGAGTGATCGNGVEDPGEECDDGNNLDGDDCSWNCTEACAVCHRDVCPAVDPFAEMNIDSCYDDMTLVQGGPAEGAGVTRAEVCTALITCVHRTQCGLNLQGEIALDQCYCATEGPLCTNPTTFVPGPCKVEVEEAAETTIATEVFAATSDAALPLGRAFYVLGFCDFAGAPCNDECLPASGGMGGMGGMSGGGGMAGRGGAGMGGGGTAGRGGAGIGGAGMAGMAGRGAGAGGGGTGGLSAMCGDTVVNGDEDCEPPATATCSHRCFAIASETCEVCEAENPCIELQDSCDTVTGTNTAGKPRRELCYELAECLYATGCAETRAEACFCGSVPTMDCQSLAPGAAMGPCARTMEAAFETTQPSQVLVNFSQQMYGGWAPVQRALCDQKFCRQACF